LFFIYKYDIVFLDMEQFLVFENSFFFMKPEKHLVVAVPLAFEYPLSDTEQSGTKARIKACLNVWTPLIYGAKIVPFIVVTADRPPDKPDAPVMCEVQSEIICQLYDEEPPLISQPKGWGTESEIKSAIEIIQKVTESSRHYNITLVIATNWMHMWRVKLLVAMYKPLRWKCVFAIAKHKFSLWSHLREIPAIIFTAGRLLISKDNL
jgi:hypothetical protein